MVYVIALLVIAAVLAAFGMIVDYHEQTAPDRRARAAEAWFEEKRQAECRYQLADQYAEHEREIAALKTSGDWHKEAVSLADQPGRV